MGMFRWLVMFAIIIAMAVLVVWERNKTIETGYQVAQLQKDFNEMTERNKNLNYYVQKLKAPEVIVNKVKTYQLALLPQEGSQNSVVARNAKEGVAVSLKTIMAGNLYTQKEQILRGRALHN
ncbi:MAG: hypothetical protein A2W17_10295 [Planctomycetes bacterium RBG_16_41_13]|nr:MAG: hypothetical protein A2W17_10295 [Planctomycetes bacterium RBG_16_41_13]